MKSSHPLVAKMEKGGRVYGTLLTSTSPHVPAMMAGMGVDFVFIDTEHIAIDRERLSWMCRAFAALGIPPIVRIPSPDPALASMVLDGGAVGILAPYVETVDEVKALCGAVKLKPLKGQLMRETLAGKPLPKRTADYVANYNRERILLINIESGPALKHLDELLVTPGLDGIVVGPHDLSVSLDLPEDYGHPDYLRTLRDIANRTRGRVPVCGVHFMDAGGLEAAGDWMDFGFNFLILHADLVYLKRGLTRDLQALRTRLGDGPVQAAGALHI